jgi:hypothetical protein
VPKHRQISSHLAKAFALEVQAAKIVRAVPPGKPQPIEVVTMVVEINALVQEVLRMLPESQDKRALVQSIGGTR